VANRTFYSYIRVSTEKQGRSGLGLEAQQKAVAGYLNTGDCQLLGEFIEVESGRRIDRPKLKEALELCRRQKATLVIAKLDRLARNVAFVSALLESGVRFIATDMPEADVTFLQMAAVFSEWEARLISQRTKAALAAAKARGKALGWSSPSRQSEQREASKRGAASNHEGAIQFSSNILPIIRSIQNTGLKSLSGIASALNARGVSTARGGRWYAATIKNILAHQRLAR
jgi:DNA invertase Pin-like site-specific DNA recombinase